LLVNEVKQGSAYAQENKKLEGVEKIQLVLGRYGHGTGIG
jgi:hypothetical protein